MIERTPAERPLVTFALFAYNQQKYIREAVEGAFSQTYEPLEIILSDDCSTDRTFEIMQEMAAAYEGPHEVRTRRNEANLGLIDHVNRIFDVMSGSVLILAAGDDISLPLRTEKLVSILASDPNAVLAHSSAFTIDESGGMLGEIHPPKDQSIEQIVQSASIYIGATGAIHRRLSDMFGPIRYKATYEDLIFGTRAALTGEMLYTDEKLVKYRSDVGIIFASNNLHGRSERRRRKIIHRIETMKQRRLDTEKSGHARKELLLELIEDQLTRAEARLQYYDNRVSLILGLFSLRCRHYVKALSSETKYLLGWIR